MATSLEGADIDIYRTMPGKYALGCTDDGVTFPVAHLLALLNVAWPLADRAAVGDLPAPVTPAQVAFAPRLLAAQVRV